MVDKDLIEFILGLVAIIALMCFIGWFSMMVGVGVEKLEEKILNMSCHDLRVYLSEKTNRNWNVVLAENQYKYECE